jgi:hypothetical protein
VCVADGDASCVIGCDGNIVDCAGECGGSLANDECGVCGGDGTSCEAGEGPHFAPAYLEYSDNPYLAMNLTITVATLDGIDLQDGDEIGIFDGEVCVGSGIVYGTIEMPSNMLPIVASSQDSSWPDGTGFTSGNPIIYRFWDSSVGEEFTAS